MHTHTQDEKSRVAAAEKKEESRSGEESDTGRKRRSRSLRILYTCMRIGERERSRYHRAILSHVGEDGARSSTSTPVIGSARRRPPGGRKWSRGSLYAATAAATGIRPRSPRVDELRELLCGDANTTRSTKAIRWATVLAWFLIGQAYVYTEIISYT